MGKIVSTTGVCQILISDYEYFASSVQRDAVEIVEKREQGALDLKKKRENVS